MVRSGQIVAPPGGGVYANRVHPYNFPPGVDFLPPCRGGSATQTRIDRKGKGRAPSRRGPRPLFAPARILEGLSPRTSPAENRGVAALYATQTDRPASNGACNGHFPALLPLRHTAA